MPQPLPDPADPQPAGPAAVSGSDTAAPRPRAWVPIRTLAPKHRRLVLNHLLALPERDRYLRFGYLATNEQIGRYVDGLNFERDEVFGVFNRQLKIVALAHLACPDAGNPLASTAAATAEFGGSVLPHLRGQGFGTLLFEHAMLHARNRGLHRLFIHALSENTVMLRIARRAGATVERSGTESDAYLRLPDDTLASHAEALVGAGAAAIDYGYKLLGSLGAHADPDVDATSEATPGPPTDQR